MKTRFGLAAVLLAAVLACNFPLSPDPLLITANPPAPTAKAVVAPVETVTSVPAFEPSPSPDLVVSGKIVFTCQIFKIQAANQICILNADGSGFRRLTSDDNRQHFYPSLAPDGQSVLYASFVEANVYDLYEMTLDGQVTRLTRDLGLLVAPEVSPDGRLVAFTRWTPQTTYAIWVMNRDGSDPHQVFGPPNGSGWDPTWSPDGMQILFASDMAGTVQLYTVDLDGKNLRRVTNLPGLRGRSDWSPDGRSIVTYAGEPWHREVYLLTANGLDVRSISPPGGNSQGPSFSPDGRWVTFTAYFDHYGDDHGCEIYIMRLDGGDLRRLTDNDYCDYQPRWGP